MPLFEYKCDECNCTVEVLALSKSEDLPPALCPRCGAKSKFTKQFSAFATASPAGAELPQYNCGSGQCCGGSCGGHGD